jgi:hypothetical protein
MVTVVVVLSLAMPIYASKSKVGTTAYSFLKIGVGARALSMGGAFVGLADDESAIYYNAAGIISSMKKSVSASYMNYIADIQSGSVMVVLPKAVPGAEPADVDEAEFHIDDAQSAIAFSANYLNYGSIDERDASGNSLGTFNGSDMAFNLTYARKVGPQLALGGSAKFIYQKIDQYSSDGAAIDAGLLYRFKDGRTNLGLSASNLGFQLSGLSPEHKDPLPVLIRAGISHHVRELPLIVSGEGVYPSDNDIYGSVGVEVNPKIPLSFRVGYSSYGSNYKTGGNKDGSAGFSFGAGFRAQKISVDYAFLPYADLGSLHRFGFAYRW